MAFKNFLNVTCLWSDEKQVWCLLSQYLNQLGEKVNEKTFGSVALSPFILLIAANTSLSSRPFQSTSSFSRSFNWRPSNKQCHSIISTSLCSIGWYLPWFPPVLHTSVIASPKISSQSMKKFSIFVSLPQPKILLFLSLDFLH